jgi:hypothetical protein
MLRFHQLLRAFDQSKARMEGELGVRLVSTYLEPVSFLEVIASVHYVHRSTVHVTLLTRLPISFSHGCLLSHQGWG